MQDIEYLNMAVQSSKIQLDWEKMKEVEGNFFSQKKTIDLHNPMKIILYRHFVELIVRTAFLKYGNVEELHRSLEKLIEGKLNPLFDK